MLRIDVPQGPRFIFPILSNRSSIVRWEPVAFLVGWKQEKVEALLEGARMNATRTVGGEERFKSLL